MNEKTTVSPVRITWAGLLAGLGGNALLGLLFTSPPVKAVLFNPAWQSPRFIELAAQRNVPVSVLGLVALSVPLAWLFVRLQAAMPGRTWRGRGLFWGLAIWLMYWLPQEWFIYHTLIGEPLALCGLELLLLLAGALVQGLILAGLLREERRPAVGLATGGR
ncbi:MAG: hypothetical protein HYV95_04525 [Opitutae bacterium]|nr:hypothetical protein [Opitutae bacterium]